VIVADGEPKAQAKTIRTQIQDGATRVLREKNTIGPSEEFPADRIRAQKIDRETYEILKRFITEGAMPGTTSEEKLAMTPDMNNAWRLTLGGPYALKSLEVVYEDGRTKKQTSETFAPGEPGGRVRMVTLGRYLISGVKKTDASAEVRPVKFIVRMSDGEKTLPPQSVEVPQEHSYWQVVVQDFPGDQRRLFEVLADPQKMANPLVSKRLSERKLVLGSMVLIDRFGEVTIFNDEVIFDFVKPAGSSPSRVWMKFPLEPEEVQGELAKYSQLDFYELPAQIIKEAPSPAGTQVNLTPGPNAARWYEVPLSKDGVGFERRFTLAQIDAWKARKNRGVHHLIVWQLDSGGKPQAFLLVDPMTKEKSPVKAEEVANWPVKIREAGPAPGR
jgi:hypothetical protein